VESALEPERFLSVGDGYSDIGQGPNGTRPTVNDGSLNWTQQIAADYGKTLTAANAGGLSWAQAYSRVTQPDTTGHDAPSITEQVTSLLATTSFGAKDVILLSGGMSDVYAEVEASGGTVTDAVRTNVTQAGTEYGQQVHRLVNAGAQYVVVTGVYNMGKTPWGLSRGEDVSKQIEDLSRRFNDAALIEINSLASTNKVLFRDSAVIYNILANDEDDTFGIDNRDTPVCTVADAYDCTTSTLIPGAEYDKYLWADSLHLTPRMNRVFGDRSFSDGMGSQLENRW
jgi:phospholipase/lecithinase/hemolysin